MTKIKYDKLCMIILVVLIVYHTQGREPTRYEFQTQEVLQAYVDHLEQFIRGFNNTSINGWSFDDAVQIL